MSKERKGTVSNKKQGNDSQKTQLKTAPTKRTTSLQMKKAVSKKQENRFHIVGMCASAGGLEAFEQFFRIMPSDSGMAFILIPHLDPTHKSIMVDLIKRVTRMKVFEARDGMQVEPNTIYVIPPDNDLSILEGRLQLIEPTAPRGQRRPIDYFFRTLAQDQGEKAICIILSGTGSDGSVGLKAIKGEGGMVIVQDPTTAKYDGMPRSAIDTGLVDYILPPDKMPEQLIKYAKMSRARPMEKRADVTRKDSDLLDKILVLVRSHTGHDFSLYKRNTIMRRLEKRMGIHQIGKMSDYLRLLQENPVEIDAFFKDLLIGVTNFFRDPQAFEALKTKVCPELFKGRPSSSPIRVWVVGCSTGEEAYSIAIVLNEYMQEKKLAHKIQIFATDMDNDALEVARMGVYSDSIAVDVSPQRLNRFFTREGNTYRVNKKIRELVVFASQNVIKDPPFSKLDMISCRNLLIYLQPELQKRILTIFHYSLKPGGILFLGSSETIGEFSALFEVIDKKWKLFRRKEVTPSTLMKFPAVPHGYDITMQQVETKMKGEGIKLPDVVNRLLLDRYAPPCVIINQTYDILYIHGSTGKYLEPAPGEPTLNVLAMAREGLRTQLQFAIRKCLSQRTDVVVDNVRIKVNGNHQFINLFVKPVYLPINEQNLVMILFEDIKPPEGVKQIRGRTKETKKRRSEIQELRQELKYTKEDFQATVEELQTANEEWKSANEELQSANEELQSVNEELETSKEELDSLNEELVTINSELQTKIDELTESNNDMKNLINSTRIATIFLDRDLKVKKFTPETTRIINLIDSDIDCPISHIVSKITNGNLVNDIESVLKTLVLVEKEVRTNDDHWYLMRIPPYRTAEDIIDGV